ncbi:MAG: hypothetical protein JJU13_02080 [Balneolaceae bacterium]|nr:hypothetical protein [Balneolaceae bacterium]
MTTNEETKRYYKLEIIGKSSDSEIWIGDDMGHLVQKAEGKLNTDLLPGKYTVEFELGSQCYPIILNHDTQLTQNEIEAGPACERPKIKFENQEKDH